MKRDIFRRGVRMQIPFGTLEERNDPFGSGSFDFRPPERVDELSGPSRPMQVQQYGERRYRPSPSPIVKPNGACADMNGPAPDIAADIAMILPVGTKHRLGPLKTAKSVK
jgi:hypothetical protein